MFRKYRRIPFDFEILMIAQEIEEITESMDLLDQEIVEEVFEDMDSSEVCIHEAALLLKARNPELADIAVMGSGVEQRLILLYRDKRGIVVGRRRTKRAAILCLLKMSA